VFSGEQGAHCLFPPGQLQTGPDDRRRVLERWGHSNVLCGISL
jgi:hypothetical protein